MLYESVRQITSKKSLTEAKINFSSITRSKTSTCLQWWRIPFGLLKGAAEDESL